LAKRLWIILLFAVLYAPLLQGQQYPLQNYSMSDGLSQAIVFRIFQDRRGFLWFCTNYGLSRFDGKNFKNYFREDGLGNNCIMSLSQQDSSTLLVSTYGGGICALNDTAISRLKYKSGYIPGKVLYAVPYKNRLWVVVPNEVSLYYIENGIVHPVNVKNAAGGHLIFNKVLRCGKDLLFTSGSGLFRLNDDGHVEPFLSNVVHENIIDIKQDAGGGYWAGLSGRLINIKEGAIRKTFPLSPGSIPAKLLIDNNGNVWVASPGDGLLLIKNDSLYPIGTRLNIHKIIINDLFQDNEGNIWIATHGEGVYRLSSLDIMNYRIEDKVLKNSCKAATPGSNGAVYIGSMGAISTWKDGVLYPFPCKHLEATQFIYFIQYAASKIYVGTPLGMMIKETIPPYKETVVRSPHEVPVGVLSLYRDGDSCIWLGSYNSIYKMKAGKTTMDSNDIVRSNVRCNAILKDHSGTIWFGTETGLLAYKGGAFTSKLFTGEMTNIINAIYEDSRQRLWFATDSGMVCKDGGSYKLYTTHDGLPNNKCNAITEDNNNILWLGTMNGLCTVNINSLAIKEYPEIYPNEILSLYSRDSFLFAGTLNGLSLIKTRGEAVNTAPPLYITAIKTAYGISSMPHSVSLPYRDNKLLIDYVGLSYRFPGAVQYRYKLAGLNDNWHITDNNEIELSSLPPGDYTFTIAARRNKGAWGPPLRLPIHIDTPFWKAAWFLLFAALFLLALIFFLTRWYITSREAKKRRQLSIYNKITYLKQQALSALINPHFIFNCLNSIQHYIFKRDHYKANIYLADFAQLIRMTMEHAQEAFIGLEEELSRIKLYLSLERLRFGDELEYEIVLAPGINTPGIRIPNMIIQPYVENAIWHGIMPMDGKGTISIAITGIGDDHLQVSIRDNGIGIDSSREKPGSDRQSFGMQLTEERLSLLKKLSGQYYTVTATQPVEGGTLISIILPLEPNEEELKWADEAFDQ